MRFTVYNTIIIYSKVANKGALLVCKPLSVLTTVFEFNVSRKGFSSFQLTEEFGDVHLPLIGHHVVRNKCPNMIQKHRLPILFTSMDAYIGWSSVSTHCLEFLALTIFFFNQQLCILHFSKKPSLKCKYPADSDNTVTPKQGSSLCLRNTMCHFLGLKIIKWCAL